MKKFNKFKIVTVFRSKSVAIHLITFSEVLLKKWFNDFTGSLHVNIVLNRFRLQ